MKSFPNDRSCAKLISKKSNEHLKISIVIFLLTISIVMVIGLLYSRQYFQYEKDFLENIAIKTVRIDASFKDNSIKSVNSSDIKNIEKRLKQEYPNTNIKVIPVYTCIGTYINGSHVNIYAIDESNCFFIDLKTMTDETVYFTKKQSETIALEISVLEEVSGGFSSNELKPLIFKTAEGVSEKTPILSELMPSMKDDLTCFVNMETFKKISSIILSKEIQDVSEVSDESELIILSDIYVYVDDLYYINPISTFLAENNYRAYTPTNSFDDFNETISVTYSVFILSSLILLLIATINIFLSFKSFYRIQQKDIGVLRYMGFDNKRIYKMFCKNLAIKFLQILFICSVTTFILGMLMFSFSHWLVLFSFIVILFIFLCLLFFVICKFIISKYVNQDLLTLIRESKEFE